MNKKIILIPVVFILTIIIANFLFDKDSKEDNILFHVTLADPDLYVNGKYSEILSINKGKYFFKFVPNGSSPEILSITLNGKMQKFSEDYNLVGIPHQTGNAKYFTWEYNGQKDILISEMQEMSIVIDPNGKTQGSVSVYIIEK